MSYTSSVAQAKIPVAFLIQLGDDCGLHFNPKRGEENQLNTKYTINKGNNDKTK